jgi:hypothetical protein
MVVVSVRNALTCREVLMPGNYTERPLGHDILFLNGMQNFTSNILRETRRRCE